MPRSAGRSDRESVQVIYHGETEKAWRVEALHGPAIAWVPKSQCALMPEDPNVGDECWLMIPQWLLEKTQLGG